MKGIYFQEFISNTKWAYSEEAVHNEPSQGVGSIDYIHGLLIAEDDLDGDKKWIHKFGCIFIFHIAHSNCSS